MNTINGLDNLNDLFFSDNSQRNFYLQRAEELIDTAMKELKHQPVKILALNRSWASDLMVKRGLDITVLPEKIDLNDRYDLILALDEVLTREADELSQKKLITQLLGMLAPKGILMASLRDYKNTNCHRRPLGDSSFNRLGKDSIVISEVNELDMHDKQRWYQKLHVVVNDSEFTCLEVGARRTLYFKQLAKYCADSNETHFGVLKNVFWKSHLRRTPEHVVYARAK